ncbi:MAG: group 1 glycosyl transferase [uncultured bacterium]|nr:MAG: group 1 glycosyl transferase [uncultured bacterium]
MKIGIDASRAFLKNRTGIEEYSYQIIKHLRNELDARQYQVVLYLRRGQEIDFKLPQNWTIKIIQWPRFWTQIGLSLEMLLNPVDTLLIPAHTVPIMHPRNTIVVVHGLEYEFCPQAYSRLARIYMRWTIKKSCKWASKIISVSENTKKDLIRLYKVRAEKIFVIYEGYAQESRIMNQESREISKFMIHDSRFIAFIGRVEQRKNISKVVEAFELLKEKYETEHRLVLAGRPGYGYENIKFQISNSKFCDDIIELGYIGEEEKWELLKNADAFLFPTLYEGFGIPILEAQSVGCPVIASGNSSIPEVAGKSALLVDPDSAEEIAENIHELLSNNDFKNAIIQKGLENVKRFSWEKCAREIGLLF